MAKIHLPHCSRSLIAVAVVLATILGEQVSRAQKATEPPAMVLQDGFLYRPHKSHGLDGHVDEEDVEFGRWRIDQIFEAGKNLFTTQFTRLDGAGRPGATGNPSPTRRPLGTGEDFVRTAGPDANSCVSCHNRPTSGGAGDFVSNVFTGLGARHPIFLSVDRSFSAERDTPELNGSGWVELLAREMTTDLYAIRKGAVDHARAGHVSTRAALVTKGVHFGYVSVNALGEVDLHEVEGVDRDLVVRPWGQKGAVTSLRTFTVNAMNLHHGMQAVERFGFHLTGSADFDRDGVNDELSVGDITALVAFQALLPAPGRVIPRNEKRRRQVARGEELFNESKCAGCHIPSLPLQRAVFSEPSPYNLEGTLRIKDVQAPLTFDLEKAGQGPRPLKGERGTFRVQAFTDLKRHRISDAERPHFGNETMVEGLTSVDEFITKRLWAVGSTAPYGHRGDVTTLFDVIQHHGGEAREARIQFDHLAQEDRDAVIEFLQSLQILPAGSPGIVLEPRRQAVPYTGVGDRR